MNRYNYKDYFTVLLHFENGIPAHDWMLSVKSSGGGVYKASYLGDEYTNAEVVDGNDIRILFENHGLGIGCLKAELVEQIAASEYSGGVAPVHTFPSLDVMLWDKATEGASEPVAEAIITYIVPTISDSGTWVINGVDTGLPSAGLTPAQVQAIELAEAQRDKNEKEREIAEGARQSAETRRQNSEQKRVAAEMVREAAEEAREVAETERQAAEESRAEEFATWQGEIYGAQFALFRDMWAEAADGRGRYNEETGFYELNGLTDITYEEALVIFAYYTKRRSNNYKGAFFAITCRTLLPIWVANGLKIDMFNMFGASSKIEVIVLRSNITPSIVTVGDMTFAFQQCSRLREIDGILDVANSTALMAMAFAQCATLEEVRLRHLPASVNVAGSPRLSCGSIQYMVDNAANTTAITITVHADVFAKLTGDTTNAAAAALTPEELAQWQQVLTDAAAKDITFVTP